MLPVPQTVQLCGTDGRRVEVDARLRMSADPAVVWWPDGTSQTAVTGWAGPWPVDQHWWEPSRHRRLARFQMLVDDDEVGERAHLVIAEHQRWFLLATYD